MEVVQFDEFFVILTKAYQVIGRDPLGMAKKKGLFKYLVKFFCWTMMIWYVCLFFCQLSNVHTLLSNKKTFLMGLAAASCESFCVSGLLKEVLFVLRKKTMVNVIDELKLMFPTDLELQKEYNAKEILKKVNHRMAALVLACHSFVVSWAFYPITKGVLKYMIYGPPFEKELAFFVRYSYDPYKNGLVFIITTIGEGIGGTSAATFFCAMDVILLAIIHNCCMHMDYITMKILSFVPSGNDVEDNKFIDPLIELHIRSLKLCEIMNNAFGLTILVNFFLSTASACFISFVILFGDLEQTVKGIFFLGMCLLQVWIICFMGQMLIDASESVAEAVYNHSWFSGSVHYRRKICIVLVRAQKPATLKPPTMNPASNILFMEVMMRTYQFFCVLTTMFDEMV